MPPVSFVLALSFFLAAANPRETVIAGVDLDAAAALRCVACEAAGVGRSASLPFWRCTTFPARRRPSEDESGNLNITVQRNLERSKGRRNKSVVVSLYYFLVGG